MREAPIKAISAENFTVTEIKLDRLIDVKSYLIPSTKQRGECENVNIIINNHSRCELFSCSVLILCDVE